MKEQPPSRSSSPATPSSHSSPSSSEFHSSEHYPHPQYLPWDPSRPNVKGELPQHVGLPWEPMGLVGLNREEQGLMLEELISADAFDPSPSPSTQPQLISYRQSFSPTLPVLPVYPDNSKGRPRVAPQNAREEIHTFFPSPSERGARPVFAASTSGAVAPPKQSISNLPIIIHNVPQHGAKSRVETQIKMTLDLALPSNSGSYERVGSWKWLKLPKGTATRKRPRKEEKIDARPDDTLCLTVAVHCASAPSVQVYSCTSCLAREAKRNERKKAARIRPERRSESGSEAEGEGVKTEEGVENNGIVTFNCTEVVDFSTGSVVLPVRVTCYCRHHREKVGFRIVFTMTDSSHRIVGKGTTPPIMITDDHKSTKLTAANTTAEEEASGSGVLEDPTKRKRRYRLGDRDCDEPDLDGRVKRRAKSNPSTAAPSPAPSPPASNGAGIAVGIGVSQPQMVSPPLAAAQMIPPQTPNIPQSISRSMNMPVSPPAISPITPLQMDLQSGLSPGAFLGYSEPAQSDVLDMVMASFNGSSPMQSLSSSTVPSAVQSPMHYHTPPPAPQMPPPQIHRLIPSSGPTHGGIEVTILGSNFLTTHQCVFGDTLATSTQLWSDNTIVCILPPSASPGPVVVGFKGVPICSGASGALQLFNYLDNSDRALMELALQVVGLKMTGRIEEAKSIAMRIVGTNSSDGSGNGYNDSINHSVHHSHSLDPSVVHSRRGSDSALTLSGLLPLGHPSAGNGDFQSVIIDFLSMLDVSPHADGAGPVPPPLSTEDAISQPNPTGQSLLHLAALLGFHRLLSFLLFRGIDVNARDNNGFTALHFAALCGRVACARLLCEGGADTEIVEGRGKTAKEIANERDQADVEAVLEEFQNHRAWNHTAAAISEDAERSFDADESAVEDSGSTDDDEGWWATKGETVKAKRDHTRSLGSSLAPPPTSSMGELSSGSDSSEEDEELPDPEPQMEPPVVPVTPIASPDAAPDLKGLKSPSLFYRTLSHLQPPPGMIPGMIPALPPWGLPQIPQIPLHLPEFPLSFPVQVPMPTWPAALQWQGVPWGEKGPGDPQAPPQPGMLRITYEFPSPWRGLYGASMWWGGNSQDGAQKEKPTMTTPGGVPMYTPAGAAAPTRTETSLDPAATQPSQSQPQPQAQAQAHSQPTAGVSKAHNQSKLARKLLGYEPAEITDREINAFAHHTKKVRKLKKDNMLVLFWLPILLIVLAWGLYRSVPHALIAVSSTVRSILPVRD